MPLIIVGIVVVIAVVAVIFLKGADGAPVVRRRLRPLRPAAYGATEPRLLQPEPPTAPPITAPPSTAARAAKLVKQAKISSRRRS